MRTHLARSFKKRTRCGRKFKPVPYYDYSRHTNFSLFDHVLFSKSKLVAAVFYIGPKGLANVCKACVAAHAREERWLKKKLFG